MTSREDVEGAHNALKNHMNQYRFIMLFIDFNASLWPCFY